MAGGTLKLDLSRDATRQGIRDQLFARLDPGYVDRIRGEVAALAASDAHYHDLGAVLEAIDGLGLPDRVKDDARAVYRTLAEAEAQVHGVAVEQTHFHEVGDAEAVANVVAICLAVAELDPAEVVSGPVQAGSGKVRCAHGLLDIPAPATAAIIGRGIPLASDRREGEWCTPTSAAIILHFVDRFE